MRKTFPNKMNPKLANASKLMQLNPNNKFLFWQVKSDTSLVYLLGSMHGSNITFPIRENITKAFNRSNALVVEANTIENTKLINLIVTSNSTYNTDDCLSNHVSSEVCNIIEHALTIFGLNNIAAEYSKYKPWFLFDTLGGTLENKIGYYRNYGLDSILIKKANIEKKQILELEGSQKQINILSSLPDSVYEYLIKDNYSKIDLKEKVKVMNILRDSVIKGDEERVKERLNLESSDSEMNFYNKKMFTERNIDMTSKINDLLKGNGSYFILVGAGHLVGDDSIINLLKVSGYNVDRL